MNPSAPASCSFNPEIEQLQSHLEQKAEPLFPWRLIWLVDIKLEGALAAVSSSTKKQAKLKKRDLERDLARK